MKYKLYAYGQCGGEFDGSDDPMVDPATGLLPRIEADTDEDAIAQAKEIAGDRPCWELARTDEDDIAQKTVTGVGCFAVVERG